MRKFYAYANCDACRKAQKFLRANGIAFEPIAIRETPPTRAELRAMLHAHDGQLRKLFNSSGADYKALHLGPKLPAMGADEAIALLAANGNLVKRPFLIGGGTHLVGFNESAWLAALA